MKRASIGVTENAGLVETFGESAWTVESPSLFDFVP
jgi:hypothetical protein